MSTRDLSLVGKIAAILSGPVTGLLPPRLQMRLSQGNTEAASLMSTTSRITNLVLGFYAAASTASKIFGADIDPTPYDAATWLGLAAAADSFVREGLYGLYYHSNHGMATMHDVWGEPLISHLDSELHPEWYGIKRK